MSKQNSRPNSFVAGVKMKDQPREVQDWYCQTYFPSGATKGLCVLRKTSAGRSQVVQKVEESEHISELKGIVDSILDGKDLSGGHYQALSKNPEEWAIINRIISNPFTPKEVLIYLTNKDIDLAYNILRWNRLDKNYLFDYILGLEKKEDLKLFEKAISDLDEIPEEVARKYLDMTEFIEIDGRINEHGWERFLLNGERSSEFIQEYIKKRKGVIPQQLYMHPSCPNGILIETAKKQRHERGVYQALRNPSLPIELLEEAVANTPKWRKEERKELKEVLKERKRQATLSKSIGGGKLIS